MNDLSSSASPLFFLLSIALLIICFLVIISPLLMIISYWKIFSKAGKPGWAAIVPIYNTIVLAEVSHKPSWWGLVIPIAFGLSMIPYIGILIAIGGGVLLWIIEYSLAGAFGKDSGFGIGLILFPMIFFPILAFSRDARYVDNNINQGQIPTSNPY